jgi:formyl-CoA transferase
MRERTGVGQHVDVSMLETMLSTDDYVHLSLDGVRERGGVIVNDVWEVVGGPILIAGDFRWVWRKLHETFEIPDPAAGDVPIEDKARKRRAAVESFLGSFTDRAELIAALGRADLPFGEVKDTASALRSQTLAARGAIAKLPDRAGGQRSVLRAPYHFSTATSGPRMPAPYRGEHNRVVLEQWLGLSADEVAAFEQDGALLAESPPEPRV